MYVNMPYMECLGYTLIILDRLNTDLSSHLHPHPPPTPIQAHPSRSHSRNEDDRMAGGLALAAQPHPIQAKLHQLRADALAAQLLLHGQHGNVASPRGSAASSCEPVENTSSSSKKAPGPVLKRCLLEACAWRVPSTVINYRLYRLKMTESSGRDNPGGTPVLFSGNTPELSNPACSQFHDNHT